MNKDLLECIADALGCQYLSDLPRGKYFKKAAFAVEFISEDEYSLAEWNEALFYIFHEKAQPTKKCAKERLVYLLRRH